jgi:sugar/nucleoside kinase (ribokinase family)
MLHVAVDRERSALPEGFAPLQCTLRLDRRRIVACAVSWQEKGIRPPQAEAVAQALSSMLTEEDFIVEKCEPEAAARTAASRGADYLLLLKLRVNISRDRYDMAKALAEYDGEIAAGSGRKILAQTGIRNLLITRGEHGMALFEGEAPVKNIPTVAREVFDVTGAGDTVISTLALGLVAGLTMLEAAILANFAAGIVVGKLGTASATPEELIDSIKAQ